MARRSTGHPAASRRGRGVHRSGASEAIAELRPGGRERDVATLTHAGQGRRGPDHRPAAHRRQSVVPDPGGPGAAARHRHLRLLDLVHRPARAALHGAQRSPAARRSRSRDRPSPGSCSATPRPACSGCRSGCSSASPGSRPAGTSSPTAAGSTAGRPLGGLLGTRRRDPGGGAPGDHLRVVPRLHPDAPRQRRRELDGATLITFGEIAVGHRAASSAILTGFAAFFGALMNMSFLLAGSASTNPVLFTLAIGADAGLEGRRLLRRRPLAAADARDAVAPGRPQRQGDRRPPAPPADHLAQPRPPRDRPGGRVCARTALGSPSRRCADGNGSCRTPGCRPQPDRLDADRCTRSLRSRDMRSDVVVVLANHAARDPVGIDAGPARSSSMIPASPIQKFSRYVGPSTSARSLRVSGASVVHHTAQSPPLPFQSNSGSMWPALARPPIFSQKAPIEIASPSGTWAGSHAITALRRGSPGQHAVVQLVAPLTVERPELFDGLLARLEPSDAGPADRSAGNRRRTGASPRPLGAGSDERSRPVDEFHGSTLQSAATMGGLSCEPHSTDKSGRDSHRRRPAVARSPSVVGQRLISASDSARIRPDRSPGELAAGVEIQASERRARRAATADGVTLRSSTPSPTSSGMTDGSAAASPHTATWRPRRRGGPDDAVDEPQDGRLQGASRGRRAPGSSGRPRACTGPGRSSRSRRSRPPRPGRRP